MSVFISVKDMAKLYVQFFRENNPKIFINKRLVQCAVSLKC